MTAGNDLFYSRLPLNKLPLSVLLLEEHLFFKIPANWHVVITDVKNSTKATEEGLHETVNLVATGSIVAILNIIEKTGITIPFFFGGDGATFIIPPSVLEAAMHALLLHQKNTQDNFKLFLRVGHVPVTEIYENGFELKISKLKSSDFFAIPILLGDGLHYAEKKIKGPDYLFNLLEERKEELDLSGMQCRWDRVQPPINNHEIVTLLVTANDNIKQAPAFKKVIECIDEIYGEPKERNPISISKLKLKTTLARIGLEMKVRLGGFRPWYLLKNWIKTLLGTFYFKTTEGKKYLVSLVAMSDTLVIDGKINTVITGNSTQREKLVLALNKLENEGEILYGLFVSRESVMSCYVRNMNDKHIHFIDGAEGGYTKAATVLKQKIAGIPSQP